jgi:hypothetical protein
MRIFITTLDGKREEYNKVSIDTGRHWENGKWVESINVYGSNGLSERYPVPGENPNKILTIEFAE